MRATRSKSIGAAAIASYLGVSRSTVYKWIAAGLLGLETRDRNGRRFVRRAALDRFVEAIRVRPQTPPSA